MTTAACAMVLSGAVLVAVELFRSIPAWLRVKRTGRSAGISPVSIGVLAGTSPGWIVVAVLAGSPAAAIATCVWLLFHLLLLVEVVRADRRSFRTITLTGLMGLAAITVASLIGALIGDIENTLGVAIGLSAAAYSIPALIRGLTSESTAGLSLLSLTTNSVEGCLYLVAGIGLGGIAPGGSSITAYTIFGGLSLLSNVPRLIRTSIRRYQRKDGADRTTSRA